MNPQQYSELARRTMNDLPYREAISNWAFGLIGEWGELEDAIIANDIIEKTQVMGVELSLGDSVDIIKEAGDIFWYINAVCITCGFSFTEVMDYYTAEYAPKALSKQNPTEDVFHQGYRYLARLAEGVKKDVYHKNGQYGRGGDFYQYAAYLVAVIAAYVDAPFEEIWEANIAKLEQRHPTLRFDPAYHEPQRIGGLNPDDLAAPYMTVAYGRPRPNSNEWFIYYLQPAQTHSLEDAKAFMGIYYEQRCVDVDRSNPQVWNFSGVWDGKWGCQFRVFTRQEWHQLEWPLGLFPVSSQGYISQHALAHLEQLRIGFDPLSYR